MRLRGGSSRAAAAPGERFAAAHGARGAFLALFALLSSAACADLPVIDEGECGNGVVEPATEDCDSFAAAGSLCNQPGAPGQCRYDCSELGGACPQGWGCGTDGLCRQPSGRFEALGGAVDVPASLVLLADFDDDGRSDILSVGDNEIGLHYFDAGGELGKSLAIPTAATFPALGRLTDRPTVDFAMNVGIGLGIMRPQPDRTVLPSSYSSIPFEGVPDVRFVAMDAIPIPGDEMLVIADLPTGGGSALMRMVDNGDIEMLYAFAAPLESLLDDRPLGQVIEDPAAPCEEIVLAFRGQPKVGIYTPCGTMLDGTVTWVDKLLEKPPPMVSLPDGARVERGVFLVQANACLEGASGPCDEHLDLVVGADCTGPDGVPCFEIDAAFGLGDGTFHSAPPSLLAAGELPDQKAVALERFLGAGPEADRDELRTHLPIAVGHLNGDGWPDYVDASAVHVSQVEPGQAGVPADLGYSQVAASKGASWTEAVIEDLNANGVPDVLAGSSSASGIDFLNGTGSGWFNPARIPTRGVARNLLPGDFDGDLIRDVAFVQAPAPGSADADIDDTLAVLFGRAAGSPEPPAEMGRLGKIRQIASGDMFTIAADAMTDMAVVSGDPGGNISLALISGSADRQLQAPFTLVRSGSDVGTQEIGIPVRTAIGRFTGGDDHADLGVLTSEVSIKDGMLPANLLAGPYRMWLAPVTGEAEIDSSQTRSVALPEGFVVDRDWLRFVDNAVVDLDGDGTDELVATMPYLSPGGSMSGPVAAIRVADDGWSFDVPATNEIGTFHARLRVADVDADGSLDVGALAFDLEADGTMSSRLVIFENEAGALSPPVTVEGLPAPPIDFAFFDADLDPQKELIVLAMDGTTHRIDSDPETGAWGDAVPFWSMPPGETIAAGDIDGDGVDDLAIGAPGSVHVQKGVPVRR